MLGLIAYRIVGAYELLIVVWAVMSWFPVGGIVSDIRSAIGVLVEPYLRLFRRIIPPASGIDFSPVVAIIVLNLVQRGLLYIL